MKTTKALPEVRGKQERPQPGWATRDSCGEELPGVASLWRNLHLGLHLVRHQSTAPTCTSASLGNRASMLLLIIGCLQALPRQFGGKNKACFHAGRGYRKDTTDVQ